MMTHRNKYGAMQRCAERSKVGMIPQKDETEAVDIDLGETTKSNSKRA